MLNRIAKNSATNCKIISVILLIGLSLMLRIHHLDHESLWMDEIRQTSFYANPLTEIIDNSASQNQPPLDYWLGHLVYFFSSSDFAVRLPAALFGTGSVLLLVMLISQLSSWIVACCFGIIFALLPFNLYYSQEARPYAISTFLFLCMFYVLNYLLNRNPKRKLASILTLLFFSINFLYSRVLSPFVVTVCLILILIFWRGLLYKHTDIALIEKKRLVMTSCGTLILALLVYMPSLKIIIAKSERYVSVTSMGSNMDRIFTAVINLDLSSIWQAYVVQSEPITYPLLLLAGFSPFFGWQSRHQHNSSIWILAILLLPMACILNLLVFQSKTNLPFRPAYVSYILPLIFIVSAISLQGFWNYATKTRWVYLTRPSILVVTLIFSMQTVMAVIDFKSMKRKPDWRGVSAYLAKNYDARHLLIFDSFSDYGDWEPTFHGFPLYYRGQSPLDSIGQIPFRAHKFAELSHNPILILFQWREYYLTPHSSYPILSVPSPHMLSIDYQKLCHDPFLSCTTFTGFLLIQLKEKSNNLAHDSYTIIKRLLVHYPLESWTVELHLAAAALAQAINIDDWKYHLSQAKDIVPANQIQKLKKVEFLIDPSRRK
jgi:uncharacterized membrane protein